jgi:hypothetical protein
MKIPRHAGFFVFWEHPSPYSFLFLFCVHCPKPSIRNRLVSAVTHIREIPLIYGQQVYFYKVCSFFNYKTLVLERRKTSKRKINYEKSQELDLFAS